MNNEFFQALEEIEKKRGIPKEYMLEKVEQALTNAFKREEGGTNVRILINPEKGDIKLYKQLTVVETVEDEKTQISLEDAKKISKKYNLDQIVEIEVKPKNFGRISAQTAKQVIIQGIREAERQMMIKEYESKREDIITVTVEKVDENTGNCVVNTGSGTAVLYSREMIKGESFSVGDHVKVFISEVKSSIESKGPIITLSRIHQNFVKRLFELEVPEFSQGILEVKSISREAGSRTKIAIATSDPAVDPIGACIGNRGSRINCIVSELSGEKIDIIRYSEDPAAFIREALSPSPVKEIVILSEEERICRAIVAPEHLSLAIGKEGQNARLAARLTNYKIDIKTE